MMVLWVNNRPQQTWLTSKILQQFSEGENDGGHDEPPPKQCKTVSVTGKEKFLNNLITSKEDKVLGESLANEALLPPS